MKKNAGRMGTQKRRRKGMAATLTLMAALFLPVGCGSGADANNYKSEAGVTGQYASNSFSGSAGGSYLSGESHQDSYEADISFEETERVDVSDGRKMIETVRLEAETKEFDQMMSVIEARVREMGGYIESMETYNGSSYSSYSSSRYANLTIRIPSINLSGFLDTVSDAGNVVRRSDSREDVTLSYVDMESRRDTLRTEQSRLLEFLDKAETIEEIITIEQRLSEVRYQLESMESRLRTMDNLVEYGTIYMDISEVRELTPVKKQTAWDRISEGFMGSLRSIGDGITEFGIWFLTNIPYLVIWAAVIAVILLIARKCHKIQVRKREAQFKIDQVKMQEYEQRRNAAGQSEENTGQP